jgi:protein TonB
MVKLISTYSRYSDPRGRLLGFCMALALQAALLCVLVSALGTVAARIELPPGIVEIIDKVPPKPAAPTLPPATPVQIASVFIPKVEINLPPSAPAPTAITPSAPAAVPTPATRAPVIVPPNTVSAQRCKPEYPPIAKDLGQAGSVVVHFVINVDGSVAAATIARSSGYRSLDQAALTALSRCGFTPGTVDGRPMRSATDLKYTFTLEDAE